MIARLLISPILETRVGEIEKILKDFDLSPNHPDLLYFTYDSKLGIEKAREIKGHFSLKPYSAKGRAVVLEDASNLTVEAQNALLKTLEEPPPQAILILGAPSDSKLLPTILSRCEIIRLQDEYSNTLKYHSKQSLPLRGKYAEDIDRLITSFMEERFEYIEKLKDREEFLHALISYFEETYFHKNLAFHMTGGNMDYKNFLKELLQAEQWAEANVNIRAILEYLMLVMPQKESSR